MSVRPCTCDRQATYTGMFLPSKTVATVAYCCSKCGAVWNENVSPDEATEISNAAAKRALRKVNGHGEP